MLKNVNNLEDFGEMALFLLKAFLYANEQRWAIVNERRDSV